MAVLTSKYFVIWQVLNLQNYSEIYQILRRSVFKNSFIILMNKTSAHTKSTSVMTK